MNEVIDKEMLQIKIMIAETVAKRETLKGEMKEWNNRFPEKKFGRFTDLIMADTILSELDSHYKRLLNFNNQQTIIA